VERSAGGNSGMNKPTILIDGAIFQLQEGKPGGISRVWRNHLQHLAKSPLADHIMLLDRGNTCPELPNLKKRVIKRYNPFLFEADPNYLQEIFDQEAGSLFISTYFTCPENSPSMIMIHDMTPEIMGLDLNHPEWRAKSLAIQKACSYLVVSNSTKNDFQKLYPQHKHKPITVIPNAASQVFQKQRPQDIQSFKEKFGIQKPYFLLVGRRDGYKNAQMFFRGFSQLKNKNAYEIFCAGGKPQLEQPFRSFLDETRWQVQHLSDQGLALAYAGAIALIYPSLYEGFGLPILEAQQSYCPVITYSNSSLGEVAGDSVLYAEPHDTLSMANMLTHVQKEDVREELIRSGLINAKRYAWKKNSQKLVKSINSILQEIKSFKRNPTRKITTGIQMAYSLSRTTQGEQLAPLLEKNIKIFQTQNLSLNFQQLTSLESKIQKLISPPVFERFCRWAEEEETDGFIHYWLGLAYQAQENHQKALDAYLQAIHNNINSSRVNYLAAKLADEQEQWELAEQLWFPLAKLNLSEAKERLIHIKHMRDEGNLISLKEENRLVPIKKLPPPPTNTSPVHSHQEPLVSIILPTKDRLRGALQFIESLENATNGTPYEILVYANQKNLTSLKDKHSNYPISHMVPDEHLFNQDESFSWAKLMNHGFNKAKGKWIFYGSDDITLYPGAISWALNSQLNPEMTGGVTFLHRNTIQTFGNYYKNFGFDSFDNKTFINFGLISKHAYHQTKGFDESFQFYWADVDLCMQIWKAGFQIEVSHYSLVDHHNQDDRIRRENSQTRYRRDTLNYLKKWQGNSLFSDNKVINRDRFILSDEQAQRAIESISPNKLAPEKTPSSQKLFSQILEAQDIQAAVNKLRADLTPDLVQLVRSNAAQAKNDGEQELAEGLENLAILINQEMEPLEPKK
jgi:glycosyltransferase involved in cell wall biosynthesis